jgi:hypothetical protein
MFPQSAATGLEAQDRWLSSYSGATNETREEAAEGERAVATSNG